VNLLVLVGFLAWLAPTLAGLWYLAVFKEMRNDIRAIRRYMQATYEYQQAQLQLQRSK
jgi:hypothetical protein